MKCSRCQQDAPSDAEFCPACGTVLVLSCRRCGTANAPDHKYCKKCGQPLLTTEAPRAESARSPGAPERRQLTVMFCDLVGSTTLAEKLDPEEMREIVRAYQKACAEAIARFEGHIAQYLGDGLLVYFGYPRAHEDDAVRAVRAALGVFRALQQLNTRLDSEHGPRLAARVGIHSGLVVVGEIGAGMRHERLALGETPNVAARLQALAEPDSVVISESTHRLVEGLFVCHDLGAQQMKGISNPVRVYRVLAEGTAQSRLEAAAAHGLTPLVGREQEVELLLSCWEQVKDGHGQVVLLNGEAGIGKSRLVEVLKERVAGEPHTRWECRCSPYHQDSALYPVIELFERALHFGRDEPPGDKIRKIEEALTRYELVNPETIALWAALLSVPVADRYPPLNLTPQRQRHKTLEAVLALLLALTARQPVLVIMEDLHWVDPSTLELLALVAEQVPAAAVLVLLTFRPDFRPPWPGRPHLTHLSVNRFTRKQTEQMVQRVTAGKALPPEVLQQVVGRTDGVPLFVEELTKMVLESGLLRERDDQYELTAPLPPLAIPTTLQDSLMARLDRLATVKDVAQLGATLGRSFSYELLKAVSVADEPTLHQALDRLVEAELLYQRGVPAQATYIFKHALIQEAAYQSLLKSRRQQFHQRIAEVLLEQFPETVQTQPELLAHHYTEAGLASQAVEYWRGAGERAVQRSANIEAIAHLTRGLEVLSVLPDSSNRAQRELGLQTTLGVAAMNARGFAAPETGKAFARARKLCHGVVETPELFPILWGLWGFHLVRGEMRTSQLLAEQSLALARRSGDTGLLLEGHHLVGEQLYWVGEFVSARPHLERTIDLYDPERHRSHAFVYSLDPGVNARNFVAHNLWYLGFPDQAFKRITESQAMAQEIPHPFSQAFTLLFAAWLHQYRREPTQTQRLAEAALALSTEQQIAFFVGHSMALRGWALNEQGQGEEGLRSIRQGMEAYRATGAELERPHWLALFADSCLKLGRVKEGLVAVDEALADIAENEVRFCEAELHRLRGELLLKSAVPEQASAEAAFHGAIQIARRQGAKSLELRAATSLSRLRQSQGNREEARRPLAEVYAWFTEGFDTVDVKAAKVLLEQLS